MRTIIVDDEAIMLKSFLRQSKDIEGITVIGSFQYPEEALAFAKGNAVDMAILDIEMPGMNGIELAKQLRTIRPDVLIVFISAYEEYIKQSNEINADYYIVKPYRKETLEQMVKRMSLISRRQQKAIYVQMFGRFTVFKDEKPVPFQGRAKEILALVASKRGKEISNEEIYSTLWEDRAYGNVEMKVYYNALKRLKDALSSAGLEKLLISTPRGQIFNTDLVDCDYYAWKDNNMGEKDRFEGEFLSEYSWGEYILAGILNSENED